MKKLYVHSRNLPSRLQSWAFTVCALTLSAVPAAQAEPLVGLTTDGQLVTFDSDTPATAGSPVSVSGLQSGETIVGIDFRPATGALYAVGSTSRLYRLDLTSGAATQIGTGAFTTALSGTEFDIDFNPVPDRLRVVSNTGQNLRINPDTAEVITDTALAFDPTDTNGAATPAVTGVAYTNNFAGATRTTLLGIDPALDAIVFIGGPNGTPSPNGGVLTTVGLLGIDAQATLGFEISNTSGRAFIVTQRTGQTANELYVLDFGTTFPLYRKGTIGIATTLRDVSAPIFETQAPTLSVTSPSNGRIRTRSASVNISGTASDNVAVSLIEFEIRRGSRIVGEGEIPGTSSFTLPVTNLRIGNTTVRITAVDIFGNQSVTQEVRIVRARARGRAARRAQR